MNVKKTIAIAACLAITPLSAIAQDAELPDDILAVINGEEISTDFVTQVTGGNQVSPEQFGQLLQQIIANFAIAQEANKLGYADKPEVKAEFDISKRLVLVRSYMRDLIKDNPITDATIQSEYDKLKATFEGRKEYRSRHILVKTEEEAKEVISDTAGSLEKFIELAKEKSVDTGSGQKGGELGWSMPENFVPEFAVALSSLEPASFSEPVQTQFGWHVIYLDESRDVPVPELNSQFRESITEQLQQALVEGEIDRLVEASDVKINEKLFSSSDEGQSTEGN